MSVSNERAPVRYGLIIGAACAFCGLGCVLLGSIAEGGGSVDRGWSLAACIVFLIFLWLMGEAGYISARQTGRTESGIIAGAIAGLLGGIGLGLLSPLMARQAPSFQHPRGSAVFGDVVAILIVMVLIGLMGAGTGVVLGALGASIGKSRYHAAQVSTSRQEQSQPRPPAYPDGTTAGRDSA
jgi:hypothetical protein